MAKKKNFKFIGYIVIFALVFNLTLPLFDVEISAYTSNSKEVEEKLKTIISEYGEENVVFENGLYMNIGEELNLTNDEENIGIVWTTENEQILKVKGNTLTAIGEGTTFLIGSKENKYYLREVYVSTESNVISYESSKSTSSNSQYVIYIDPGHGGSDPGASGNGIIEKNLVLSLSLKLKEKLEGYGIKVIMSRITDVYVSLQDRANNANVASPDLFISVHINAAGAKSASGIETFYYKNIDKPLAESIQSNLISYTGAVNRGAKSDEYYVVKNTNMPASLIELGFLTNNSEATKLKNTSYQEKLVNAMLNGTLDYLYDASSVTANRIYGANRYETSYKLFESGWSSSEYAVLTSGLDYPDALSATPLASKYDAPILLVSNTSLKKQISLVNLLKSKGVKNVFIVGGTGVVPSSFESELKNLGITSKRLGGKNRYETSVQIAKEVGTSSGEVSIVSGLDFADGLSISSIVAKRNMPILLTQKDQIPDVVLNYLNGLRLSKTYIIGSTGAVSNNVANKLSNVERLGGSNRYETNKIIFNKFKSDLDVSKLYIASGLDFPDALSVSALAGKNSGFVVLSHTSSANLNVKQIITSIRSSMTELNVVGSNAVISDKVLYELGINFIR